MTFCTVINCMDGRVQLPVIRYLKDRFGAEYVDSVTEAGPVRALGNGDSDETTQSILERVRISVEKHNSVGIAVAAHHDCAGNPVAKDRQLDEVKSSVSFLRNQYGKLEVVGLWVDDEWRVQEISA